MLKLAASLALSSAILCTACGDDYGWADLRQPGTAVFEVSLGEDLSLVAEIALSPEEGAGAQSITIDETQATVEVSLPPGEYSAELAHFTLFEAGEALADADVRFVGFEPDPIVITPFGTTHVTLTFEKVESGEEIQSSGDGPTLNVITACSPGCGAGEVCAAVNGAEATCYDTCDDETPCTADDARCAVPEGADSGLCL